MFSKIHGDAVVNCGRQFPLTEVLLALKAWIHGDVAGFKQPNPL